MIPEFELTVKDNLTSLVKENGIKSWAELIDFVKDLCKIHQKALKR